MLGELLHLMAPARLSRPLKPTFFHDDQFQRSPTSLSIHPSWRSPASEPSGGVVPWVLSVRWGSSKRSSPWAGRCRRANNITASASAVRGSGDRTADLRCPGGDAGGGACRPTGRDRPSTAARPRAVPGPDRRRGCVTGRGCAHAAVGGALDLIELNSAATKTSNVRWDHTPTV